MQENSMHKNFSPKAFLAGIAFLIWGGFPLLLNFVEGVSAFIILAHRIFWCLIMMLVFLWITGRPLLLSSIFHDPLKVVWSFFSAIMLAVNWFAFVYSVEIESVLEASAGYYIYPILASFLGMLFLKEKFFKIQWFALLVIIGSVFFYIQSLNLIPYVSVAVAVSFALYSVIHKMIKIPFDVLCTLELSWLTIILIGLYFFGFEDLFVDVVQPSTNLWILISFSLLSCIALFTFNVGLKFSQISSIGITFFTTPTLQMFFGVFFLSEILSPEKGVFFLFIFLGVILYLFPLFKNLLFDKKVL